MEAFRLSTSWELMAGWASTSLDGRQAGGGVPLQDGQEGFVGAGRRHLRVGHGGAKGIGQPVEGLLGPGQERAQLCGVLPGRRRPTTPWAA